MPFSPQQARTLDDALSKLLQTFAEKQSAARPKRCVSAAVCGCSSFVCCAVPAHTHPSEVSTPCVQVGGDGGALHR